MNILVAEDEIDIRNLIKITLEDEGYSVITACDGIEALKKTEGNTCRLSHIRYYDASA